MKSTSRPNVVFIMSDDHAAHAISAYGSGLNRTPHIDRLAEEGLRLDHCYCTNSICTPSRATILTGQYGHVNGVRTLRDALDGRMSHLLQKQLQSAGYQTAIVGKWHLGHGGDADPTGFDYTCVLPKQGDYHDPAMIEDGVEKTFPGYVSEIITDKSLEWLRSRDPSRPFCLMCHHKAPHRPWSPGERYKDLYADDLLPEPPTLFDDYATRAEAIRVCKVHMEDLNDEDLKAPVPDGLTPEQERRWRYQRYIKDYLRCCASVDNSVGRILDFVDAEGLRENTIVIYTSDQGFFLGDHNLFDKRFMYEESLRMPFLIRYPAEIPAGAVSGDIVTNTDFAPTLLDLAGVPIPGVMQGTSARDLLRGETPAEWQQSMYYRYWMHGSVWGFCSHYGVRTKRYKLIYYYADPLDARGATREPDLEPEWELFDTDRDPLELNNVYSDPAYADAVRDLKAELDRLQRLYGDAPAH
jgi:arylsulfatase A-like enzyme